MTLPTDELIQKATTMTSNWQTLIPQLWAARIEVNLRKTSVFMQSLTVFDDLLVPGAGDVLHVPWLPDLGPVPPLQEGVKMDIQAMPDSHEIPLKPTEYGMMYSVTRKMLDRIKYNGIGEILDRFSYSMQQTLETQCASLYKATVPGTTNGMDVLYANWKGAQTITPNDVMNDKLILDGLVRLRAYNNVPFPNGRFLLYITPAQWEALLLDANIRADLRFVDPGFLRDNNAPLNGVIASIHGVDIIVTNYIQQSTEGANNDVTVNNALLVAPRWACVAWKRRPEALIDPTLYDLGRTRQMGITADFSIDLLHYARALVLKSA